jgi:hypothetical protein
MKVGIMQPYFLPYIGYFQLLNAVDIFVVYDNIEYTKKGWINRNRILVNGKDEYFTIPIKKDSDFLNINQRFLAETFEKDKIKILRKINESYRKAPFYEQGNYLIEDILSFKSFNLFEFIFNSIIKICYYLDISTQIVRSSEISIDHSLKSEKKVISICNFFKTNTYINSIGGIELYSKVEFKKNNLELIFLKTHKIEYKQFDYTFVPLLSILDIIMFNSKDQIKSFLNNYKLI